MPVDLILSKELLLKHFHVNYFQKTRELKSIKTSERPQEKAKCTCVHAMSNIIFYWSYWHNQCALKHKNFYELLEYIPQECYLQQKSSGICSITSTNILHTSHYIIVLLLIDHFFKYLTTLFQLQRLCNGMPVNDKL